MAMPSAYRLMRMTRQLQKGYWRMNMDGDGRKYDERFCQLLDDVKTLTPESESDRIGGE